MGCRSRALKCNASPAPARPTPPSPPTSTSPSRARSSSFAFRISRCIAFSRLVQDIASSTNFSFTSSSSRFHCPLFDTFAPPCPSPGAPSVAARTGGRRRHARPAGGRRPRGRPGAGAERAGAQEGPGPGGGDRPGGRAPGRAGARRGSGGGRRRGGGGECVDRRARARRSRAGEGSVLGCLGGMRKLGRVAARVRPELAALRVDDEPQVVLDGVGRHSAAAPPAAAARRGRPPPRCCTRAQRSRAGEGSVLGCLGGMRFPFAATALLQRPVCRSTRGGGGGRFRRTALTRR